MPIRPPGLLNPRPDNTIDAVLVSESGDAIGAEYPNDVTAGHDLIADGDLVIGPLSVLRTEAVMLAVNSTDGNNWSASADWEDGNGNVLQEQSASDLNLDTVAEDWVRVVRKGPQVEFTITDVSGAASNTINAYVDTEQ